MQRTNSWVIISRHQFQKVFTKYEIFKMTFEHSSSSLGHQCQMASPENNTLGLASFLKDKSAPTAENDRFDTTRLEISFNLYLEDITIQHTVKLGKINNDQAPEFIVSKEAELSNLFFARYGRISDFRCLRHTQVFSNPISNDVKNSISLMSTEVGQVYVSSVRKGFVDPDPYQRKFLPFMEACTDIKQSSKAWTTDPTSRQKSDHVGCLDTQKSTSGRVLRYPAKLAQVMWIRKQLQDYGFNYNKIHCVLRLSIRP
ncbi:hypothetical protein Tco_0744833 [Tanacetum coccineum]